MESPATDPTSQVDAKTVAAEYISLAKGDCRDAIHLRQESPREIVEADITNDVRLNSPTTCR